MIVLWIFLSLAVLLPVFTITFFVLRKRTSYHKAQILERIEGSILGIAAAIALGLLLGAGI